MLGVVIGLIASAIAFVALAVAVVRVPAADSSAASPSVLISGPVGDLLGSFVMVNDVDGDGYVGLLASVSDGGVVRLERSADRSLTFIDGQSRQAQELVDFVNIPAARVKFITGVS